MHMVWLFLTRKKCVFWHCAGVTGRHRGTVAASGACAEVNPLKSLIVAFDVEALSSSRSSLLLPLGSSRSSLLLLVRKTSQEKIAGAAERQLRF